MTERSGPENQEVEEHCTCGPLGTKPFCPVHGTLYEVEEKVVIAHLNCPACGWRSRSWSDNFDRDLATGEWRTHRDSVHILAPIFVREES